MRESCLVAMRTRMGDAVTLESELSRHYRPEMPIPAFDGTALLSARTIISALDVLTGLKDGEVDHSKTISPGALANALWLLETYVMSKGICFDGTVDPPQQERIRKSLKALENQIGKTALSTDAATPDYADPNNKGTEETSNRHVLSDLWMSHVNMSPTVEQFELYEGADRPLVRKKPETDEEDPTPHLRFRAGLQDLKSRLAGKEGE